MRAVFQLAVAALCAAALLAPATAQAAGRRHTTVFEEVVDGAKQPSSAAELRLIAKLKQAGVPLVDEGQSRKIRSVTDAGTLLSGTISPVITTLDADVIVAAICKSERVKSELLGADTYRYDATIQAKVISVDDGAVLGAFRVRGEAIGLTATDASGKAAERAADALAVEVLKLVSGGGDGRVELTITGIPGIADGERILTAVKKVSGVKGADIVRAGQAATKIVLTAPGQEARALALALERERVGVTVVGYSRRAIRATYRPEAAMRLPVVITPLAQKGKKARHAWQGPALAGIVGAELANLAFVELPKGTTPVSRKAVKKLGLDPKSALVLAGTYRVVGEQVAVAVQLDTLAGVTVASQTASCKRAELATCVREAGGALAKGLMPNLLAKRHLLGGVEQAARLRAAGAGSKDVGKPVRIDAVTVDNVYPSRLSAYAKQPIGRVKVTNAGAEPATNLVIQTALPGFVDAPLDTEPRTLKPGETAEIPVRLVLSRDKLRAHDDNRPAVMQLGLHYDVGDMRVEDKRSQALIVYDRNTLSWKEIDSVGAFVTPNTAAVRGLAHEIARARPNGDAAWTTATALFVAMREQGLRYQKDPVNPYGADALDYVQYPEQTLSSGSGDCDDLAVLYAALAEALGLETLLVATPKHVFVAVDTGVPARAAATLSPGGKGLIVHDGRAWLPLETTLIRRPVVDAWQAAAKELARFEGREDAVKLVQIRRAWERFPPVSLVAAPAKVKTPSTPALKEAIDKELKALEAQRKDAAEAEQRRIDEALAKDPNDGEALMAKGVLLAGQGKLAEALPLFEKAAADPAWTGRALNNAANVRLAMGQVATARKVYTDAIAATPKEPRVLANAALAAYVDKDEDRFADLIFSCLELGAEKVVLDLARAGLSVEGGTRGADAGGLAARDLTEAIRRAYERKKRAMPEALSGKGVRAGDASATISVDTLVYWL